MRTPQKIRDDPEGLAVPAVSAPPVVPEVLLFPLNKVYQVKCYD